MIVVVGLSHKTAPIEVREQAALSQAAASETLRRLHDHPSIDEVMVISTCNRVEVVAVGDRSADTIVQVVRQVLSEHAPIVGDYLYAHVGMHAVNHLFRVAASLDSLVLGEPQILGQVKASFERARDHATVGQQLHRAYARALRVAKRVRNETLVGVGQVSVPSVAMDLARQIFGELRGRQAALIGSGQMGESMAKLLSAAGVSLDVVGRNQERVARLAGRLRAKARGLEELNEVMASADVIVSTTSAPGFVVTHEGVARVRRRRRGRSLFLIDLAVPRDIDPRTERLDSVFLYNVDDLSQIVAETMSSRRREAELAEQIVAAEVERYERGVCAEQVTPTIVALRQQLSLTLHTELQRSLRSRLKHLGDEERDALGCMLESSVKKVLHGPTCYLRQLASEQPEGSDLDECVQLLHDLFGLGEQSGEESTPARASRRPNLDPVPQADEAARPQSSAQSSAQSRRPAPGSSRRRVPSDETRTSGGELPSSSTGRLTLGGRLIDDTDEQAASLLRAPKPIKAV